MLESVVNNIYKTMKRQYEEYMWDGEIFGLNIDNYTFGQYVFMGKFEQHVYAKGKITKESDIFVPYVLTEDESIKVEKMIELYGKNNVLNEMSKLLIDYLGNGFSLNGKFIVHRPVTPYPKSREVQLERLTRLFTENVNSLKREVMYDLLSHYKEGDSVVIESSLEDFMVCLVKNTKRAKEWGVTLGLKVDGKKALKTITTGIYYSALEKYKDAYLNVVKEVVKNELQMGVRESSGGVEYVWGNATVVPVQQVPHYWLLTDGYEPEENYIRIAERLENYIKDAGIRFVPLREGVYSLTVGENSEKPITLIFSRVGFGTSTGIRLYARGKEGPSLKEGIVLLNKIIRNKKVSMDIGMVYDLRKLV